MMKIYPEPARDKIWFEFSETSDNESKLSVLDDAGALLILKRIDPAVKGDIFVLDLSSLRPGSYQLVMEVDNQKHFQNILLD